MPGYAPIHPVVGVQPMTEMMTPDTTQRWPLGMVIDAVDPYFGYGRFMYLESDKAHNPGDLVIVADQTFVTADLPNTANLGIPFLVCRQVFDAASEFGWFQFEGVSPIKTAASVAQGVAVGIGGAGEAGANGAGKQLLGVRVLEASTFTLTALGQTINGSKQLGVSGVNGLFVGLAVSGTGIAGGTTISSIDPSGRFINLSAAATATGSATMTFTYTGFLLAHLMNPHTQGAIT